MSDQPNKLKALSIFLIIISIALIAFIFYNYTKNGQVSYISYAVAVICLIIGLFPLLFNKK